MRRAPSILGLLALLVLLLIFSKPLTHIIQKTILWVTRPVLSLTQSSFGLVSKVIDIPQWIQEHEQLKKSLAESRHLSIEVEELQSENARLRDMVDFRERKRRQSRESILAQVIGRSSAGWRNTVLLSHGTDQGIEKEMTVLTPDGLVGRVESVWDKTAKVQLLTHPEFRVGGLVQRTRHTGVVYGTVDGECRMKYLAVDSDVKPGDRIVTAGLSPGFPKGIGIGEVFEIWKEPGRVYKVAAIKLFSDLDRLEEVLCLRE